MNDPDRSITNDGVVLSRFASGDLTPEEENAVLLDCEIEPSGWRALALAVVEHRRLERGLAALTDTRVAPAPGRATAPWIAIAAIAACVGVAIGFGLGRPSAAPGGAQPTVAQAPVSRAVGPGFVVLDETVTAELANAYRPLFDPAAREVIRQHGYRIDEQPRLYFLGDDADGSRVAVPSRNIKFTYVGQ